MIHPIPVDLKAREGKLRLRKFYAEKSRQIIMKRRLSACII
jgi:hypothetical protein